MAAPLHLPTVVAPLEQLRRALRLRCPRCGEGAIFDAWFTMRRDCVRCGLEFEREPGYFVGAIYVNYAVTALLSLGVPILVDVLVGVTLPMQLVIASALAVLVPIVFFRYSRSLWLGIQYLASASDEASERRRRRPR